MKSILRLTKAVSDRWQIDAQFRKPQRIPTKSMIFEMQTNSQKARVKNQVLLGYIPIK